MIVAVWNRAAGVLIAIGLVAGLPARGLGQSPHDTGGVGAEGLIGRGTIPEERPFAAYSNPETLAPVYAAAPLTASSRPLPVANVPSLAPGSRSDIGMAATVAERPPTPAVRPPARVPALVRPNPYMAFHRGWVHGYWNVRAGGPAAWRSSTGATTGTATVRRPVDAGTGPRGGGLVSTGVLEPRMGLGWGLPAWLIGPMAYRWGYFAFANPYLVGPPPSGPARSGFPEYSRPVNTLAAPPTEAMLNEALRSFRAARDAFRREDYTEALKRVDQALKRMPEDPSLQGFRGLTLLALHRYREAAEVLYPVVAVVPGWDWTTIRRLYDDPETYTRQLRLLESYSVRNPRSAVGHFLLAYEYLTTGYADDATAQLDEVAALLPGDRLVAQLIQELRRRPSPDRATPASSQPGDPGKLVGTWIARPRADATITLTIQPEGHLTWKVNDRGQDRQFSGFCSYLDGILTLDRGPGKFHVRSNHLEGPPPLHDADPGSGARRPRSLIREILMNEW